MIHTYLNPRTGLYDMYDEIETDEGVRGFKMTYDPKIISEEEMRKVFEEKMKECFTWSDKNVWRVVVQGESIPAPSIYVLRLDDHKWCIHKGQLVLEDEGYVGKVISIEFK